MISVKNLIRRSYSDIKTIIDESMFLECDLSSNYGMRIDGRIVGNISAKGDIIIGKNATVSGNISAKNVTIAGKVKGDVTSEGIIHLLSEARLLGNIRMKSLVSDEGSIFTGSSEMVTE